MKCYINGIGIISPQRTFVNSEFLTEIISYDNNILTCVTPDFKAYMNPAQLRRLSRMLRIGMTAATICLKDAGINVPDGIVTATGYGFLEETEKFLRELLERNEKQLTPTYFMQGTYNALAGVVALSVKCTGYNNTYVSKGFAFENALHDCLLRIAANKDLNLLLGSYDESASVQYTAGMREHQFKTEPSNSLEIFKNKTPGCIQGESSAFFDLSGQPSASTWCSVEGIQLMYLPDSADDLKETINLFLNKHEINETNIDVVISGMSGDSSRDQLLEQLENILFNKTPRVYFKHLSGEFCTATSFGMWLASSILKKQHIPDVVKVSSTRFPDKIQTILLVNHYFNRNYSIILLKRYS
ncbi:MAG TPA: beta-ketoacyl synthase chain length factor [Chryseolinea sp.]|nr:beta-ketoacyl synthase chain length factor [Chryseolinea sp.]